MESAAVVKENEKDLPVEVQVYFWQQTGAFLKQNLTPVKYEPACNALQRLLCAYNIKEVRLYSPELANSFKSLPRWSLIRKALPTLFQCCSKVFGDRLLLRSDEKLPLSVKKLAQTLHFCLIEAPGVCEIPVNQVILSLHDVELFVQLLVPCVHNMRERDLEFNFQDGIAIWQPLRNHQAPNVPWLIRPVIDVLKLNSDDNLSLNKKQNALSSVARIFDVAVLKCLKLENWADDGIVWCLRYISQYLQNLLLNRGIVGSHYLPVDGFLQIGLKKHSSFPKRAPVRPLDEEEVESGPQLTKKSVSSASSKDDISVGYAKRKGFGPLRPQASFDVPDEYKDWISIHGNLSLKSVLEAVWRITDNDVMSHHCETVLQILTSLCELGIVDKIGESYERAPEYEHLIFSIIGLIKHLGCEYENICGTKAQKSQKLRTLAHHFLRKVIKMNEPLARATVEKFAIEKEDAYIVEFLHALTGCCEGKSYTLSPNSPDRLSRSTLGSPHDEVSFPRPFFLHSSSESKAENEALYLEVCLRVLLHNYEGNVDQILINGAEYLEELSKILTYVKNKHEKIFRKILMCGILESFQNMHVADRNRSSALIETAAAAIGVASDSPSQNQLSVEPGNYDGLSPKSKRKFFQRIQFKTILGQEPDRRPKSPGKQRKPIPQTLKQNLSDASDENVDGGLSPADASVSPSRSRRQPVKDLKLASESLRQRLFGRSSGKRKLETISFQKIDEEKRPDIVPENFGDKITNIIGLRDGMMQLRILFDLMPPGQVPEAAAVGAMLDLEAPVLARAAFLLECIVLVHRCKEGEWPALMKVGMLRKGKDQIYKSQLTPYQCSQLKHEAGMLFYGWGASVAKKLDEVCKRDVLTTSPGEEEREISKKEENTRPYDDINLFLEGDSSLLTKRCPSSLKYLACQLLLEITVFLREVFQYFAHSSTGSFVRDRAWTATSRASTDVMRRFSSQVSHNRAVRQLSGKTSANPVIAVEDDSSWKGTKVKRKESIYHTHKSMTSPRSARKLSRHKSKFYVPKSLESNRADMQRSSPHASLEVGSEDGLEDEEPLEETTNFPWLRSIVSFCKHGVKPCDHHDVCAEWCLEHQGGSCAKLISALVLMYELQEPEEDDCDSDAVSDPSLSFAAQMALSLAYVSTPVIGDGDLEPNDICSKYLINEAFGLLHAPFSTFCKAAQVADKQLMMELMPVAWEALLHEDQHLTSAAACTFLISASQLDAFATSFVQRELQSSDPNTQAQAVQRFSVLWKSRFHVWSRMEDGSLHSFKIPPPKMDYILPSPLLGGDPPSVPDPPWVPGAPLPEEQEGSDGEEKHLYNIDQEKHLEIKERRKQEKLRKLRIEFQLRTVSISQEAAVQLEFVEDEDAVVVQPVNQLEVDFFPPPVSAVTPDLIQLIDDATICDQGISVGQVAQETIYKCLVEDPELFFSSIFEKITKGDKQVELLLVIRKLLTTIPVLPPAAASLLFNNLAGVIMYYHRMNKAGSHAKIAEVLNVLWQVVPGVPNLMFKDMKQSLKKEHAESVFMVTANVPGAKKIAVTYANNTERLNVQEEMSFGQILRQCKSMFETADPNLYLVDKHSGVILEEDISIRDVYSHMRGYAPPVLKMEKIESQKAYSQRQVQAVTQKLLDIGKLLLSDAIFKSNPNQRQVTFLYAEFYRQISFPRRAIQLEFDLCHSGPAGKEVFALDVLQKIHWTKFIALILEQLSEAFPLGEDIQLFINVINGALLLHAEDMLILRNCLAGLVNIARHFGKMFSVNGYQSILPTLLRVYSHHHDNKLVKGAIEFTATRFLILHQTSFVLQLFGCAASILQIPSLSTGDAQCALDLVPSICFFSFVDAFDSEPDDTLGIMDLVHGEIPLKPYDSSCKLDPVDTNRLDMAIRLAVTVIAYCPESLRATQMLVVLSSLIPHFLIKLQQETDSSKNRNEALRLEIKQRKLLVSYIGIVIQCSEFLRKTYKPEGTNTAVTEQNYDSDQQEQGATILSWSWWANKVSSVFSWMGGTKDDNGFLEDVERLSVAGDNENPFSIHPLDHIEREALNEYYLPRMVLLYLASDFITKCTTRGEKIKEQIKGKTGIIPCICDDPAAILIDISISMLRLALYDQDVLRNVGLQRFMLEGLPYINWSREKAYVFAVIVDRFVKIFERIISQPELIKFADWDAVEVLLRGINITLKRQKNVAKLGDMKALMNICIQLILGDIPNPTPQFELQQSTVRFLVSVPFANTVAKLASRLIIAQDSMYSLRGFCTGYWRDVDSDKMERFLLYWMLPLCLRLGTGRFDYPVLKVADVKFALGVIMFVLSPNERRRRSVTPLSNRDTVDLVWSPLLSGHPFYERLKDKAGKSSIQLTQLGYLGLKIIVTAFESSLSTMWSSIASTLSQISKNSRDDVSIWEFYHYVICVRSPLMMHILPHVRHMIYDKTNCSDLVKNQKSRIERDLWHPPQIICKAHRLQNLLDELTTQTLKEQELARAQSAKTFVLKPAPPRKRRNASVLVDEDLQNINFDDGASDSSKNDVFLEGVGSPSSNAGGSFRRRSAKRVSFSDEKPLQRGKSEAEAETKREKAIATFRSYVSLDESSDLQNRKRPILRQHNIDSHALDSPEGEYDKGDGAETDDTAITLSPSSLQRASDLTSDLITDSMYLQDRQKPANRGKSRWSNRRQEWLKNKDSSLLRRRLERYTTDTLAEEEGEYQDEFAMTDKVIASTGFRLSERKPRTVLGPSTSEQGRQDSIKGMEQETASHFRMNEAARQELSQQQKWDHNAMDGIAPAQFATERATSHRPLTRAAHVFRDSESIHRGEASGNGHIGTSSPSETAQPPSTGYGVVAFFSSSPPSEKSPSRDNDTNQTSYV